MKVLFSGLCVFDGWKSDGIASTPVNVILTRADDNAPHHPVLTVASRFVASMTRPSDFAFVGPDEHEFLGWNIQQGLTLPIAYRPDLELDGTDNLIDLVQLTVLGGGEPIVNPNSRRIALSVAIARGSLTAVVEDPQDQPTWNYIARDIEEIPAKKTGESIKIADRVVYEPGYQDENGPPLEISLGSTVVKIKQKSKAERALVWVTNISRNSQAMRERGERNQLDDVAMHYDLFTKAPPPERRLVPIIKDKAMSDENTPACVKEMCRVYKKDK